MNVIDRARERIERGGWHQGSYGDYRGDGPVCMMGALNWLRMTDDVSLVDAWTAQRYMEAEARCPISVFNDDPSTSLEDVLLVMKRASALLDEEAAS